MRWRQGRRSTNVEDTRGMGPGRRGARGGGGMKVGGGAGIILLLLGLFSVSYTHLTLPTILLV